MSRGVLELPPLKPLALSDDDLNLLTPVVKHLHQTLEALRGGTKHSVTHRKVQSGMHTQESLFNSAERLLMDATESSQGTAAAAQRACGQLSCLIGSGPALAAAAAELNGIASAVCGPTAP